MAKLQLGLLAPHPPTRIELVPQAISVNSEGRLQCNVLINHKMAVIPIGGICREECVGGWEEIAATFMLFFLVAVAAVYSNNNTEE